MGDRPDVKTASAPIAALDLIGLGAQLGVAMARVPFRDPFGGQGTVAHRLGATITREALRSFMGFSTGLRVQEFRSVELVLDRLCKVVLRPPVDLLGVEVEDATIGGVSGTWYRHRSGGATSDGVPTGVVLYLHGGGYVGTSPSMYAFFVAELAKATGCAVFVADYRMAPEFPFPAGLHDAVAVLEALLDDGIAAERVFVAGDSGGGGLATSLMWAAEAHHLPRLGGLLLFSPEVDLTLDEPSITENADHDILPWNIPTAAYLQGIDPSADYVSAIHQHVDRWPPTYVCWGGDEMFRDAIRLLVQHLEEAHVETTAREVPGMFHVFPIVMPWADSSRRVLADAGQLMHDLVDDEGGAAADLDADEPRSAGG
jgi:acetyl esterase/lipase